MQAEHVKELLEQVKNGAISIDQAVEKLRHLPFEELGFACVDHHRQIRQGFPEVIFCQGKTPEQVAHIFLHLARQDAPVLATRATIEDYEAVSRIVPEAVYRNLARCIVLEKPAHAQPEEKGWPDVLILSAGTADLPVAEEAAVSARTMGHRVELVADVGVSGIHRLFDQKKLIQHSRVVIAVAGMEGALPSVVAGLTARPVIAVPTSVGYGASLGGIAALLAMLNSCAPGVAVVNIDNGYGAAAMADAIIRTGRED
ncbi:MAG: nickel pincer cofactor biosynthesis protein LarB [Bacillota bacterium]|nr:nickel pincer cofactor biosynthesis protein LarB [Bacillota bacterium]